jgi:hypothetical protein
LKRRLQRQRFAQVGDGRVAPSARRVGRRALEVVQGVLGV